MANESIPILGVIGLKKYFSHKGRALKAVDGVDLSIRKGETLGIVGESGSGKSTLGRSILRLLEPTEGEIQFKGEDITGYNARALRELRKKMQIIFQDPFSSLNPRMNIGAIIGDGFRIHKMYNKEVRRKEVEKLMELVGLSIEYINAYPHELSGGQQQRVGIARALALQPEFIVCDEPVSALDVSIQAQIINLLEDLQKEFSMSYLFIAHNLAVVKHISKRVCVMYLGRFVEIANTDDLYNNPLHPYTKTLLSAIPDIDRLEHEKERIELKGEIPSPLNPPKGCHFHPRCPYAIDRCREKETQLHNIGDEHLVACHLV